MTLTRKDIEEIMGLLEASRFDRLALEMDGLKLELARSGAGAGPSTGSGRAGLGLGTTSARPDPVEGRGREPAPADSELVGGEVGPTSHIPAASARGAAEQPAPAGHASHASQRAREGLVEVKSPLLGVFYRAPKPGEPPFVEVGDRVEPDTVIGIIEVMKLMNSARAGVAGEVVEILAVNGEMVEHGEALMLVRPD